MYLHPRLHMGCFCACTHTHCHTATAFITFCLRTPYLHCLVGFKKLGACRTLPPPFYHFWDLHSYYYLCWLGTYPLLLSLPVLFSHFCLSSLSISSLSIISSLSHSHLGLCRRLPHPSPAAMRFGSNTHLRFCCRLDAPLPPPYAYTLRLPHAEHWVSPTAPPAAPRRRSLRLLPFAHCGLHCTRSRRHSVPWMGLSFADVPVLPAHLPHACVLLAVRFTYNAALPFLLLLDCRRYHAAYRFLPATRTVKPFACAHLPGATPRLRFCITLYPLVPFPSFMYLPTL